MAACGWVAFCGSAEVECGRLVHQIHSTAWTEGVHLGLVVFPTGWNRKPGEGAMAGDRSSSSEFMESGFKTLVFNGKRTER